jgi:two-component system, chemotaxis family, CheB/CheR fusion protein
MADIGDDQSGKISSASPKPVVVGIGASAGGVRALQELFDALPEKTGAAFVVVVHLDPEARSELSSILAARSRMPVAQVGEAVPLEADHVYVIPPDRRLLINNDELASAEFDEPRGRRAPIDLFFRSLAEHHGDGCAVILTGAGSDGAVGVKAVKESGGIILVQDPNEAEYPSMPRSAIATGVADFVLPVEELAGRLVELVREKSNIPVGEVRNFNEELLRRILAHVRVRTGHDFSKYKRATILRRIARRMQVTRTEDPKDYYDVLRDNSDEAQALLGDLLISVTSFFRDKEAFEILELKVIPQLFAAKTLDQPIRVWVPGCATGEEAYTVSMLLLERASRHAIRPTIQVFGTDLDAEALATAREGQYPAAIEADVSDDRLRRFFTREGDHYRVRQELRDLILFANHSLLKDPPFSRVDLISCRNLLIYLDRDLQELACNTLHYALNHGGFLLLGSSETADHPAGLFRVFDRKARIYQSLASPGDVHLLPRLLGSMDTLHEQAPRALRPVNATTMLSEAISHRQAIEKLAPPSILVDQSHRVIHMSDNAGRYLQPAGGPLTGDVVDLVRPELRYELRSSLHRVFESARSSLSMPIPVRFNGSPHCVLLQVKPADEQKGTNLGRAVVLFIEGERVEDVSALNHANATSETSETVDKLREELAQTQARLRTTREESESANEELRAANEELQSINEEYRSTAEELETSKEELQSINEELQTVNSELKLKLEVVSRAHNDLQNLMVATDFGMLFLDSDLHIKRYTKQVTELFSITPSDEGRPIVDFTHQLEYENLVNDAQSVLDNLVPIRHEIRSRNERWYDVRLRPYRTVDDRIDGLVLTFVDMTERRHMEEELRESERRLRQEKQLVELSHDPIFIWEFNGTILEWNRGSQELYGYSREEAVGKSKDKLLETTVPGSSFAELRVKLLDEGKWSGELKHRTKDGREVTVQSRIVLETVEGRQLALESTRDVTDRKNWEAHQKLLLGELTHRVKNILAVVQAIADQTRRHSKSTEDFMESLNGRLSALVTAHSALVELEWKGADLATMVRRQLEPYISGDPQRVRIAGEATFLTPELATAFGQVLHELATNAAKYGALSREAGTVDVSWSSRSRNNERHLTFVWREHANPPPDPPGAAGFGTTLIERAIPNATASSEFGPDGMLWTIELPLPGASDVRTVRSDEKGGA